MVAATADNMAQEALVAVYTEASHWRQRFSDLAVVWGSWTASEGGRKASDRGAMARTLQS